MTSLTHHDEDGCIELLHQINDYIDGKLAVDLCLEIQQHMVECPNCRVVFDTINNTILLYRQLDDQPGELPGDVEQRLFRRLDLNPA